MEDECATACRSSCPSEQPGCSCSPAAGRATTTTRPSSSSTAAPLASLLPQALRDKGTLIVGSDVAYAPVEFFDTDGKTVIGLDPDLAKAIGKQLGVELKFVNGTFDGLITSLTRASGST